MIMKGFVSDGGDFKINSSLNGKPVKLCKNGTYVVMSSYRRDNNAS